MIADDYRALQTEHIALLEKYSALQNEHILWLSKFKEQQEKYGDTLRDYNKLMKEVLADG